MTPVKETETPSALRYPTTRCGPEIGWITTSPPKIEHLDSHIAPDTQTSKAKAHLQVHEHRGVFLGLYGGKYVLMLNDSTERINEKVVSQLCFEQYRPTNEAKRHQTSLGICERTNYT